MAFCKILFPRPTKGGYGGTQGGGGGYGDTQGGGYMAGGIADSQGGGGGGQRNKDKQSILPVNIKQVMSC